MNNAAVIPLDLKQARRSFNRAADGYDAVAVLQHEIGQRLVERLDYIRLQPNTLLDVGAGTGFTTIKLAKRWPMAHIIALDIASAMLANARARATPGMDFVCGDAQTAPLRSSSCDLIFSNLTLQWCPALGHAVAEFARILNPHGLLLFTTFGPDTLFELKESWAGVDGYTHVHGFIDMHHIGDALVQAGFTDPVMDTERLTLSYNGVDDLMCDLKTMGAHNVATGRPHGLTGKGRLSAMRKHYEAFRQPDQRLPATFEVVYGHAWGAGYDTVAEVPVDRISRPRKA